MILPRIRDPRFILDRRGGTLLDEDHRLLASWAALCALHVLLHFEEACPADPRPREAIDAAKAWARREIRVNEAKIAAYHSNAAARGLTGAAKEAALSAGQAAAVAHVAAHELGAAAYGIRAAQASGGHAAREEAGRIECAWQRVQLPERIRQLVLDDQASRNDICWFVFS
jgi:hypothetical protein